MASLTAPRLGLTSPVPDSQRNLLACIISYCPHGCSEPSGRVSVLTSPSGGINKAAGAGRNLWRSGRRLLGECFRRFFSEDTPFVAASVAFYALLSVFPLSLICLSIFGLFVRRYQMSEGLALVLARYLPMNPDFILENLISISHSFGKVTLFSSLLLLWAASGVYLPIQRALDRAWDIPNSRPWWRSQLVAVEMVILVSLLVLLSFSLTGVNLLFAAILERLGFERIPVLLDVLLHGGMLLASFGITVSLFLAIYHRLPNRSLRVRQVLPSALFAAVFWEAARTIFTLLLPYFNYRRLYGSIGIVVMLMTWFYVSSLIMLLGAQLSAVLYRTMAADRKPAGFLAGSTPLITSREVEAGKSSP